MLALSIECARSLIKEDDLGLAHESSCNGNPLLLSAREAHSSLTDERFEALWEQLLVLDEGQGVCLLASLDEPFVDLCFSQTANIDTIKDVVLDATREKDWLLLDESNLLLMVPCVVEVLDVLTIEEQSALNWIVESLNQLHNGRLAAARLTNKGHDLVLLDVDVDAFQHRHVLLGWIFELHVLKLDGAVSSDLRGRVRSFITFKDNHVGCHNENCDFVTRSKHFRHLLDVVCDRT